MLATPDIHYPVLRDNLFAIAYTVIKIELTKAAKVSQAEKRLAIAATKALGLKVAGVDLLRGSNGPLLLDINATPELKDIESVTGKDLAGTLIHAVEKKLKWKRPLHTGADVAKV